ncbi:MAG: biosynthetic-type acetolactate synthase large subunit [Rikenellaceae bacterium]
MLKSENISGAEAILLSLIAEGVDTIFGYPGGTIIPIYDKLYGYTDQINHILTRHEQGAVHAAQGYSRATGKVGVCMATSGPGATNFVTGIADAMVDSTPIICITAQVASTALGSDAFQEADMISMTMPITKWNYQVTSASEIATALAKAFYISQTGRPGPVVLEVTKDAQVEILETYHYKHVENLRSYNPTPTIKEDRVKQAAELINSAKQPLFIVGQGVMLSGASSQMLELVDKTDIPVASTLMSLSTIPSAHRRYVGMVGMHGTVAANVLTQKSDLIVAIGMRFSDRVTGDIKRYAPNAKIVHIDIDRVEIGKVVPSYLGIVGDAKTVIEMLMPLVEKSDRSEWFKEAERCLEKEYKLVISKTVHNHDPILRMGKAVDIIAKACDGEAIIVTDVGQQQMYAARYSKFKQPRSFVTSGGLGTMGYGLPAAMGAKLGRKDRDVVAILGDGGFQMTMQELGTIAQNNIGVKIVILNNSFLGMVRQWQQLFFERRYSFTELQNPDFSLISAAYGIESSRVSDEESLKAAVKRMFEHKGSYLLEVIVDREENVFPMVPAGASISEQICDAEGN